MKHLFAIALVGALACKGASAPPAETTPKSSWSPAPATATLPDQVVWDFEHATLAGVEPWVGLFDFAEVGAFEILLRRYDLLGRLPNLTAAQKADLAKEDGTPYPPERERRNVGRFFERLAQPTVGTGGCTARPPRWHYNQRLGVPFEPLPPGNENYEALRLRINAQLERGGGVVGIRCTGGTGGLALVYTPVDNARGYDLITIYDDGQH